MDALTQVQKLDVIGECAANSVPVVILYVSKSERKSRVVRIDKVDVNKEGGWYISGEDSLSGQYRSFLVANIEQIHALSFGPLVNVTVSLDNRDLPRIPGEADAYQFPVGS